MIERLSGRRAFDQLRADGRRRGRGPLRLLIRADPTQSARVAYAIPRSVGNAVERNRIKRRLRAVLNELDHAPGGVPGGDYLIRVVGPIEHWSHATLRTTMAEILSIPEPTGVGEHGGIRR